MTSGKALSILEDIIQIYVDSSDEEARREALEAQEYIEVNLK